MFPFRLKLQNPPPWLILFLFLMNFVILVMTPAISIWAINLLFEMNIPLTLWTWLASLCLITVITQRQSSNN